MMKKTNDGFLLSEEDLRLRGGGDTVGLRQSGLPHFRFAVLNSEDDETYKTYLDLFEKAHEDAKKLITEDPVLGSPKGAAAFNLLQFFMHQIPRTFNV